MFVFLLSYVAVSVYIGDFYKMPVSVALLLASVWAVAIYGGHSLPKRIDTFSRAAGHPNILYMVGYSFWRVHSPHWPKGLARSMPPCR